MKTTLKLLAVLFITVPFMTACNKDPLLLASDYTTYFDEHPVAGKIIGNISAGSSEGKLTFSVVSSAPAEAFNIDPSTGELSVNNPLVFNYEANPFIEGEVRVESSGITRTINVKVFLNNIVPMAGFYNTVGLNVAASMGANYLLGTKFALTDLTGKLQSFNLLGRNTGTNVQMALYNDNNGVPGTLVASSSTGIVNSWGITTLPVIGNVTMQPGNYWIMAVYSATGDHVFKRSGTATVYYKSLTYGNTPPSSAADFLSYTSGDFSYFIVID